MKLFSKTDFKSTKWFVLEKFCQLIIGIYIVPKIFNNLGAFKSGELELSKAIVGAIAPFFFLGLSAICIRELATKPQLKHKIIGTTLVLRLWSFLAATLLVLLYTCFTETTTINSIVLIIASSYFFRISDVSSYFFIAEKKYNYVFLCKIITLVSVLAVQYYGVTHHFKVYFFASLLVLESFMESLIYIIIIKHTKLLQLARLSFSKQMATQLLKDAFPLLISNFIIVLYISIDDFFINYYLGSQANGVYAVVDFLVIFITWNFGAAIIYGLFPALAKSYKDNKTLYKLRIKAITIVVSILGTCIGLFYTLFGNFIIETQYNNSFVLAKTPLKIYAWSPLFIFIGMLFEKHLVNENKLKRNVFRFVLGCSCNAIFCILLIPNFKLIGAASAVLISHIITNFGFIFIYKSYRIKIKELISTKL